MLVLLICRKAGVLKKKQTLCLPKHALVFPIFFHFPCFHPKQTLLMKKTFAGHDLRTQLTAVKVALGGKMDELKELDLDTLTENQFDKKMAEIKKLVSDSKMLRVQVKAVARELVAWLHFLFW